MIWLALILITALSMGGGLILCAASEDYRGKLGKILTALGLTLIAGTPTVAISTIAISVFLKVCG